MDPFSFAPIAFLLSVAYNGVEAIATVFEPLAGAASAALAIVALTLIVRSALIPVGISQVKAEWARRKLAPKLKALQLKYKKKPEQLQKKTMDLYKSENVSPFAGILPLLAQAPILSIIYALFIRASVDGHANALLTQPLLGVPLGTSFTHLLASGAVWPGALVFVGLFVIVAVVAWLSRRTALKNSLEEPTGLVKFLSWMPFITVIFAAVVPLAATVYLATTTVWTFVERALLRRRLWV